MKQIMKQNKKVRKIILQVAEVAQYLWQRGWAERNAGNISVNISHLITDDFNNLDDCPFFKLNNNYPELSGKYFFVSGTGRRMRDLARKPLDNALLIKLNDEGNGYWIISGKKDSAVNFQPTSELPTHLAIHQMVIKRGTDEKVVMHTHANELVALTQIREFCNQEKLNKLLWGMHPETMVFVPGGVGFVPYVTPGTEDIAVETLKALQEHKVALWEKHGVFSIGESVFDTFDTIDILAKSAKIFFLVKSAGYHAEGLSDNELEVLKVVAANF
jgi:rhamnulose-1-phosphate aldolase